MSGDCNNPTFYPVILSSVDGECVFTEYDLSTSLYDRIWNEVEDWAWPCHGRVLGAPGVPVVFTASSVVPNHTTPANATVIYMGTSAVYGSTSLGGSGPLNQANTLNHFLNVTGTTNIATMSIEGPVMQDELPFAWTATVTAAGSGTIDGETVVSAAVSGVADTGQSTWGTAGSTMLNVTLEAFPQSVTAGGGGSVGTSGLNQLSDVSITSPASGDLLTYGHPVAGMWANGKVLEGNYGIEGVGGVALTLSGDADGTLNVIEVFPATVLDESTPEPAFMVSQNGDVYIGGYTTLFTHNVSAGSQIMVNIHAGQTSAPFVITDAGDASAFYVDASANVFVSGTVSGTIFQGTTLSGVTLSATTVSAVTVSATTVEGITVYAPSVSGATVSGTTVEGLTVYSPSVSGTTLSGTTIKGITIQGTTLSGTTVSGTNVSGTTLSGTTVKGITIYAPSVSGVTVSGTAIKGITGAFTSTVTGVSGTGSTTLTTKAYVDTHTSATSSVAIIDHGGLTGLGDDDHTQYTLVAGTRDFTGAVAGVAFGASQGVSGAIVSGTTVEGITVKGTTLSGTTLSGTNVSGVTVSATNLEAQDITLSGDLLALGAASAATVSGTAVEGLTVYAPSVSGVTVSGTTVKGVVVQGTTLSGVTVSATTVSAVTVSATNLLGITVTGIDHGGLGGLSDDDHTQYIIKTPSTTGRNTITQGASNRPPFAITPHASNSVNITTWYSSGGADAAHIAKDHSFGTSGAVSGTTLSGTTVSAVTASATNVLGQIVYAPSVSGTILSGTNVSGVTVSATNLEAQDITLSGDLLALGTVSAATVSGTAVEGLTVYSPSVSGTTLSGTTVKGITVQGTTLSGVTLSGTNVSGVTVSATNLEAQDVTLSGDLLALGLVSATNITAQNDIMLSGSLSATGEVSATSATTGDAVPTANMAFQRPFHHTAYRSGSFTNGQQIRLFLNTTDNDANFVIPAGETLKILAAYGRCKSGGTAGTTTWTLGIQTWETQAHSGARDWDLATGSTTDTNSYINVQARGTLDSPLATIVGADDPMGMVFIEHANGGGGSSGNDKHTIDVYGVFVDS